LLEQPLFLFYSRLTSHDLTFFFVEVFAVAAVAVVFVVADFFVVDFPGCPGYPACLVVGPVVFVEIFVAVGVVDFVAFSFYLSFQDYAN
jgi:hypothetical protein